ncbi:hypothetical protein ACI2WT_08880 [Lysinibacillus fusiformis]
MQVCECMNDSSHVFIGRHLDGVSCPICGGPVLPKPYDERKDSNLLCYRDLKKQSSKPKSAITIDLNFDDKSKLKLRAIAKHVGALADELDAIDNFEECPKCSKLMSTSKLYSSDELKSMNSECECGYIMGCDFGNKLPTQLEGSE